MNPAQNPESRSPPLHPTPVCGTILALAASAYLFPDRPDHSDSRGDPLPSQVLRNWSWQPTCDVRRGWSYCGMEMSARLCGRPLQVVWLRWWQSYATKLQRHQGTVPVQPTVRLRLRAGNHCPTDCSYLASWKMIPMVNLCPVRTRLTPWRMFTR